MGLCYFDALILLQHPKEFFTVCSMSFLRFVVFLFPNVPDRRRCQLLLAMNVDALLGVRVYSFFFIFGF